MEKEINIFRTLDKAPELKEYLIIYFKKKSGEVENRQGIINNPVLLDNQYIKELLEKYKNVFSNEEYTTLVSICKAESK